MPAIYRPPLRDMQFVLRELAGVDEIAKLPGYEDTTDVLDAILDEASTFATEVLDPINQSGDKEGCTWNDGVVTTPKGFKEAYKSFAQAGWIGHRVNPRTSGSVRNRGVSRMGNRIAADPLHCGRSRVAGTRRSFARLAGCSRSESRRRASRR